jgi:hypothetical protein
MALAATLLACAALIISPAAASAAEEAPSPATPTTTVHYTKETQQDYERQLAAGEIQSATFNKKIRSLHLTLKNGNHVLFIYPAHDQPKLASELEKKGITVTVLKKTEADKEATAKPVHHKLRYIAGGILVVIVIVVATVLLIDRKRKQHAE